MAGGLGYTGGMLVSIDEEFYLHVEGDMGISFGSGYLENMVQQTIDMVLILYSL